MENENINLIGKILINFISVSDFNVDDCLGIILNEGSAELMSYAINKGADINKYRDHDRNTLLHLAVVNRNMKMVKCLVENNINTKIKNRNNETALDIAKKSNETEMTSFLESNS